MDQPSFAFNHQHLMVALPQLPPMTVDFKKELSDRLSAAALRAFNHYLCDGERFKGKSQPLPLVVAIELAQLAHKYGGRQLLTKIDLQLDIQGISPIDLYQQPVIGRLPLPLLHQRLARHLSIERVTTSQDPYVCALQPEQTVGALLRTAEARRERSRFFITEEREKKLRLYEEGTLELTSQECYHYFLHLLTIHLITSDVRQELLERLFIDLSRKLLDDPNSLPKESAQFLHRIVVVSYHDPSPPSFFVQDRKTLSHGAELSQLLAAHHSPLFRMLAQRSEGKTISLDRTTIMIDERLIVIGTKNHCLLLQDLMLGRTVDLSSEKLPAFLLFIDYCEAPHLVLNYLKDHLELIALRADVLLKVASLTPALAELRLIVIRQLEKKIGHYAITQGFSTTDEMISRLTPAESRAVKLLQPNLPQVWSSSAFGWIIDCIKDLLFPPPAPSELIPSSSILQLISLERGHYRFTPDPTIIHIDPTTRVVDISQRGLTADFLLSLAHHCPHITTLTVNESIAKEEHFLALFAFTHLQVLHFRFKETPPFPRPLILHQLHERRNLAEISLNVTAHPSSGFAQSWVRQLPPAEKVELLWDGVDSWVTCYDGATNVTDADLARIDYVQSLARSSPGVRNLRWGLIYSPQELFTAGRCFPQLERLELGFFGWWVFTDRTVETFATAFPHLREISLKASLSSHGIIALLRRYPQLVALTLEIDSEMDREALVTEELFEALGVAHGRALRHCAIFHRGYPISPRIADLFPHYLPEGAMISPSMGAMIDRYQEWVASLDQKAMATLITTIAPLVPHLSRTFVATIISNVELIQSHEELLQRLFPTLHDGPLHVMTLNWMSHLAFLHTFMEKGFSFSARSRQDTILNWMKMQELYTEGLNELITTLSQTTALLLTEAYPNLSQELLFTQLRAGKARMVAVVNDEERRGRVTRRINGLPERVMDCRREQEQQQIRSILSTDLYHLLQGHLATLAELKNDLQLDEREVALLAALLMMQDLLHLGKEAVSMFRL